MYVSSASRFSWRTQQILGCKDLQTFYNNEESAIRRPRASTTATKETQEPVVNEVFDYSEFDAKSGVILAILQREVPALPVLGDSLLASRDWKS
jgi:hypothetical protein